MTATVRPEPATSLLEAWLDRDDLFDRLHDYNPAFREFRRVLGDEEVAKRVSLADVAAMVDSPAEDLVAIAGGRVVDTRPSRPMAYTEEVARAEPVAGTELRCLDTRPIFESGHEPLPAILKLLEDMAPGEALVVEAPFHPAPLRRLLGGRGYLSEAVEVAHDHWRVTFRPAGLVAPAHRPGTSLVPDGGTIAAVLSPHDVRGPVITQAARHLLRAGARLAGVIQVERDHHDPCRHPCDMALELLPSGERLEIAQKLGGLATGCRLDHTIIEEAAGRVDGALEGIQLLVVNKFGRLEAEGRGFRPTIARAAERGLPALIGVAPLELPALESFVGDQLSIVPAGVDAVLDWCWSRMSHSYPQV